MWARRSQVYPFLRTRQIDAGHYYVINEPLWAEFTCKLINPSTNASVKNKWEARGHKGFNTLVLKGRTLRDLKLKINVLHLEEEWRRSLEEAMDN